MTTTTTTDGWAPGAHPVVAFLEQLHEDLDKLVDAAVWAMSPEAGNATASTGAWWATETRLTKQAAVRRFKTAQALGADRARVREGPRRP